MGDHLRFFSSHSPDSSRSHGHTPDPYGPHFAGPWAEPGAYSQDDHIRMAREEMQRLISTDGPTTSWLYSEYYSQPSKGGNYGPPAPPAARPAALQRQLNVGAVNDPLEKEADAVADRVMRNPKDCYLDPPVSPFRPFGQRKPDGERIARQVPDEQEQDTAQLKPDAPEISRIDEDAKGTLGYTHAFEKSDDEEDMGTTTSMYMQREANGTGAEGGPVPPELQQRIEGVRNSGGEKLPDAEREFFESRMGRDFGEVRIHTGSDAAQVSRDVNAKAFTIGRDVVFGEGEYKPGTPEGRRLMAHELTHTVQQGATGTLQRFKNFIQRQVQRQQDPSQSNQSQIPKLSDQQKKKMTATVLAEAYPGQEDVIRWVYYNRMLTDGFEKALRASNAYRKDGIWYRIWMIALGDAEFSRKYGRLPYPNHPGTTISKYMQGAYAQKFILPRARELHKSIEAMFTQKVVNPYEGWIGQGNLQDINIDSGKWREARQYLHLQMAGKVTNRWIVELPSSSGSANYSYIFHETAIHQFFKRNRALLPRNVAPYSP